MELKLWKNFSKKNNSTKTPLDSDSIYKEVKLKENCSTESPIFMITLSSSDDINFNYCYWNSTYFFITDVVYISNNLYEIYTNKDVLATYKNAIGNYTCMIARSASSYNTQITDSLVYPEATQTVDNYYTDIDQFSGSMYVLRLIAKTGAPSADGIATYAMTATQLQEVINTLFDDNIYSGVTEELSRVLMNPIQYLISVSWLPIDRTGYITSNQTVYFKDYSTGLQRDVLSTNGTTFIKEVAAPSAYFNDFRDFDSRYTQFSLTLPAVGTMNVSPIDVYAGLNLSVSVDFLTGDLRYILYNRQTNAVITKVFGQISSSVQIAGASHDIGRFAQSEINSAGSASSGNLASLAGSQLDVINTIFQPTPHIMGSVGSKMDIATDHTIHLTRRLNDSTSFATSTSGRPLMENRKISSLSGYVECNNASINIAGHSDDRSLVNSYLNGGFYYE